MPFPSILDAANKESYVCVVCAEYERWTMYKMHCFRTQDHQKRILKLQSRMATHCRGWEILAKSWG
jgi:hypothetical protein